MESKIEINHSLSVSEDISQLFLSERLSDVVFIVEGKRIASHKVVLATRSPAFKQMLFESTLISSKREIHINDCSALSFKNFIKYIYSGKLCLNISDEVEKQEMLALALKYQMTKLVESILEPKSEPTLSVASAVKPQKCEEPETQKSSPKGITFEDIANVNNGAIVVEGINPKQLFSAKKEQNLDEKYLTKHKIDTNTKGLIIKLNVPVIINLIKLRLFDGDPKRYYCYYIQISSSDSGQWQLIADYRYYSCRSWQTVFFEQKLVQFIRIVGTHSNEKLFFSNSHYFTIISFYCGLTKRVPKMLNGFWAPNNNIASIGKGAIVVINNGNDYCRNAKMINDYIEFEYKKYNNIYSEFSFDADSQLIVHLPQPIATSSLSFFIYGEEKFKYTVKVSVDPIDKEVKNWILVADKRKQFNASKWQYITFPTTKVSLISIGNIRCLDESVNILPILAFNCP